MISNSLLRAAQNSQRASRHSVSEMTLRYIAAISVLLCGVACVQSPPSTDVAPTLWGDQKISKREMQTALKSHLDAHLGVAIPTMDLVNAETDQRTQLHDEIGSTGTVHIIYAGNDCYYSGVNLRHFGDLNWQLPGVDSSLVLIHPDAAAGSYEEFLTGGARAFRAEYPLPDWMAYLSDISPYQFIVRASDKTVLDWAVHVDSALERYLPESAEQIPEYRSSVHGTPHASTLFSPLPGEKEGE